MSNNTQHSSRRVLDLTTFLSDNQTAQQTLDAVKNVLSAIRDAGHVRIFTMPTFEELIASSQIQYTLENNDIKAIIDVYPLSTPPDDIPIISVGFRIGNKKVPVLEIAPGPLLVEQNRVSFWIPDSGISAIAIKILEEVFIVRDETKIFSLIASYVSEKNNINTGIEGLIVEDLEMANIIEKNFTFSFYKWKSLPFVYSVAYTSIPYFHGIVARPDKVLNILRSQGIEIKGDETLNDLLTEENTLVNALKVLVTYLNNVSKRKRDVSELIYEGIELKEDTIKEKDLPSLLIHGFKQGSYMFLGVIDISLLHVITLISLAKYYYKAEDLYLKNIKFASTELSSSFASPKTVSISGRKGTLLYLSSKPPSPTLSYRMARDFGIAQNAAHILGFNASGETIIPIDSIKRAMLDVIGIIRKAINKGWRIEGGSLVKEDENGKEFKELLAS